MQVEIEKYLINSNPKDLEISNQENLSDFFQSVKIFYNLNMDYLMHCCENGRWFDFNPEPFLMSPIEKIAWQSIRLQRKIQLYPQFPIANYFVDFANPFHKIVLELDGKDFHDERKDYKRDDVLKDLGWKVFRIKGSECMRSAEFDFSQKNRTEKNSEWMHNTIDGVLTAMSIYYFNDTGYEGYTQDAYNSLKNHQLTRFL